MLLLRLVDHFRRPDGHQVSVVSEIFGFLCSGQTLLNVLPRTSGPRMNTILCHYSEQNHIRKLKVISHKDPVHLTQACIMRTKSPPLRPMQQEPLVYNESCYKVSTE